MVKQYVIRVLNTQHDVDSFQLINLSAGNLIKILDTKIDKDEKKFLVELDIAFAQEYFDIYREIEVGDPHCPRDYDDGSFNYLDDNVEFDIDVSAIVKVKAYLTFSSDGSVTVDRSKGSMSLEHVAYSVSGATSARTAYDVHCAGYEYTAAELISLEEVADMVLKDESVDESITDLLNEMQFELEEVESND